MYRPKPPFCFMAFSVGSCSSIHAELKNTLSIEEAHEIVDKIEQEILHDMNIFMVIHMDPIDTDNENVQNCKSIVCEKVKSMEPAASIHDFRMVNGVNQINLIFDLVLPYSYKKEDCRQFTDKLNKSIKEADSRYNTVITVEHSFVK